MKQIKIFIILLIAVASFFQGFSQTVSSYEASDPSYIRSYVKTSAESYNFYENANFYALQLGFLYAIGERHQTGITIPFYHNVFNADYGGFENTTGMGDIKMSYMVSAYNDDAAAGLNRVSPFLEVSAPTGEYQLGRGAGVWLYKPGIIFSIKPTPELAFYPEVKYQFSTSEANSQGGIDGLPDPEDPTLDLKYSNLIANFPMVIVLNEWGGWFSLNAQYSRSFTEDVNFFFVRMDIGKMIGDRTSASLNISKFIAGQPRLNVVVQARFNFYLRPPLRE